MKKTMKLLSVFALSLFMFTACSKDDDPKDNDLFVGTYEGSVSYRDGDKNISADNGSVTVSKVGDRYDFNFSDDIPSINDIEIKKGENRFELDWDELSVITIDESKLDISMIKDGKTWTANCKR